MWTTLCKYRRCLSCTFLKIFSKYYIKYKVFKVHDFEITQLEENRVAQNPIQSYDEI